jgi:hypothetical protein
MSEEYMLRIEQEREAREDIDEPATDETDPKQGLTKEELLKKLKECDDNDDNEEAHSDADQALLEYINDEEITNAFNPQGDFYYA